MTLWWVWIWIPHLCFEERPFCQAGCGVVNTDELNSPVCVFLEQRLSTMHVWHRRPRLLLLSLSPGVHSTFCERPVCWQAASPSVWKWHRQGGRDFPSFLSFPIADWLTLARKWSSSSGTINANRSSCAVEAPELENIAAAEEREGEGES